jgi:Protein of unknown function (DUF433)
MAENSVIDISSDILHGTPVFAGTRVPVKALFDYLKGGEIGRGRAYSMLAVLDSFHPQQIVILVITN